MASTVAENEKLIDSHTTTTTNNPSPEYTPRKSTNASVIMIGGEMEDKSNEKTDMDMCAKAFLILSYLIAILTFPFSLLVCMKVVQEYERAVIFRLGRLLAGGAKGPGIFFILPCIESYSKVDLRTVSFDVPPQEVLTRDSVTVSVDAVIYYRVSNAIVSVANVENAHHSTRLLAQTTLRNVLGTKDLSQILSERDIISNSMQEILTSATFPWGITVERVEIKDVRLPVQLQRAMAREAEAAREAGAKVIAAEGEKKASNALRLASDVLNETPTALQLRFLQTMTSISAEKNSTIIFPLPMDMLTQFMPHATVNQLKMGRNKSTKTVKINKIDEDNETTSPTDSPNSCPSANKQKEMQEELI